MVFACVQAYLLIYSVIMFFSKADCVYPSNSIFFGVFIWGLTRAIQDLIWVYPVMYILWPRGL